MANSINTDIFEIFCNHHIYLMIFTGENGREVRSFEDAEGNPKGKNKK